MLYLVYPDTLYNMAVQTLGNYVSKVMKRMIENPSEPTGADGKYHHYQGPCSRLEDMVTRVPTDRAREVTLVLIGHVNKVYTELVAKPDTRDACEEIAPLVLKSVIHPCVKSLDCIRYSDHRELLDYYKIQNCDLIYKTLPFLRGLKELKLGVANRTEDMRLEVEGFKETLETFSSRSCRDSDLEILAKNCKQLKRLDISCSDISDKVMLNILQFELLEELNLCNVRNLSNTALLFILEALIADDVSRRMYFPRDSGDKSRSTTGTSSAGTSSASTPTLSSSGTASDNNNSDNSKTEGTRSGFIPSADIPSTDIPSADIPSTDIPSTDILLADILPAGSYSMSSFSDVSLGGISLTGILSEVNSSGLLPLACSPTSITLSELIAVASASSSAGGSSARTHLSGIPSQLIPSRGIPPSGKDSVATTAPRYTLPPTGSPTLPDAPRSPIFRTKLLKKFGCSHVETKHIKLIPIFSNLTSLVMSHVQKCSLKPLKELKHLRAFALRYSRFCLVGELLNAIGSQLSCLNFTDVADTDFDFIRRNCTALECLHLCFSESNRLHLPQNWNLPGSIWHPSCAYPSVQTLQIFMTDLAVVQYIVSRFRNLRTLFFSNNFDQIFLEGLLQRVQNPHLQKLYWGDGVAVTFDGKFASTKKFYSEGVTGVQNIVIEQ
jgi:hypothetical protein